MLPASKPCFNTSTLMTSAALRSLCKRIGPLMAARRTDTMIACLCCRACWHGARQLEESCLRFIQAQKAAVVVTESFGRLAKEWPAVMLKVNMFFTGVSENQASAAFEALEAQSQG